MLDCSTSRIASIERFLSDKYIDVNSKTKLINEEGCEKFPQKMEEINELRVELDEMQKTFENSNQSHHPGPDPSGPDPGESGPCRPRCAWARLANEQGRDQGNGGARTSSRTS